MNSKAHSDGLVLCLDVGNSQVYAGLFDEAGTIALRFRQYSGKGVSADEYGVFLKSALRENGFDPQHITSIVMCSVVPDRVYSIRRACAKYFAIEPLLLQAGVRTGLQVGYRNPLEVGADRIANAVGAAELYPGRNCIIADLGTATTLEALTGDRRYLGGSIAPGLRLSMEVLEQNTAKLPAVEILSAEAACGRSTVESIQSGLYFGHLGMMRELVTRIREECFDSERSSAVSQLSEGAAEAGEPLVIGTGGFAHLFADAGIFDVIEPDLVLFGLYVTLRRNQ
ncbi:type III pantothenate kinase [Spirochaeta africana]|uniref:Type III pantothenate kinase n=1 Tax=Spirochaeta africana (strain ATCC 700263 / DSM 8902 / Z-7692) TaxID=889378 RepID=H9UMV9_SPIAZ|nr:type III pantothenate kinase [Spirochaeta africana]AFG38852.1 pantothenate kinase, type III [Spirochaeta africana DSM 8902]